jgi:hypothetical protein
MSVTPGAGPGDATPKLAVSVAACAPADGQPNPPPELVTVSVAALASMWENADVVPFVQPMPPTPEPPLPIVCPPVMLTLQDNVGWSNEIAQPVGNVMLVAPTGCALWFHIAFRVTPAGWQAAVEVSVVAKPPNETQGHKIMATGVTTVVPDVAGAVPASDAPHVMEPLPGTARVKFVDVRVSAPPGWLPVHGAVTVPATHTVVADAGVAPTAASAVDAVIATSAINLMVLRMADLDPWTGPSLVVTPPGTTETGA